MLIICCVKCKENNRNCETRSKNMNYGHKARTIQTLSKTMAHNIRSLSMRDKKEGLFHDLTRTFIVIRERVIRSCDIQGHDDVYCRSIGSSLQGSSLQDVL